MATEEHLIAARDRAADLAQLHDSLHVQGWFEEEMLAAFGAFSSAKPDDLAVLQSKVQALKWLQNRLNSAIRLGQEAEKKLEQELANEQ